MLQLIGRTYRSDAGRGVHIALLQSDESGRTWWETTRFVIERGERYSARETHETRTDAMRVVRAMATEG